jgi:tripeptide aminopeptidase
MHPAIARLLELLAIPGTSTEETATGAYLEAFFRARGVPAGDLRYDRAQDQSEYGGQCGNLIVRLPGRGAHPGPARLFLAHMDSVALCRGTRPRLVPAADGQPTRIVNDNPASALGADNRSGVAVLLHLADTLLTGTQPYPPLWFVFTVQEELGLIGARGLDLTSLVPNPPQLGFNYDGRDVRNIVVAVTGTTRMFVDLHGKAAHTGVNPQDGVSTAAAAAVAIAELVQGGWHGPIRKGERRGSANVGILQGGEMTNTCMSKLIVRCEARSHDQAFRQEIVDRYRDAFARAAAATRNAAGECVRMEWKLGPCYDSYALRPDEPVIRIAAEAVRRAGREPVLEVNDGGMDSNWIVPKGVPMVTLGTGQRGAHTVAEWIDADEFLLACRLSEEMALR